MKKFLVVISIIAVLALAFTGCSGKKETSSGSSAVSGSSSENQTAQSGGGNVNVETKAGEVWVEDGLPSSGWIFENGIAYRANKNADTNIWKKNENNTGTYSGNTVIDGSGIDYTATINGNQLTLTKGMSMTYTKATGQSIQ